MSESVTLKSYFYEVLIPSSQKNTSSPIEDILHHVSISFMKKLALYKCFNPRTHTGCDLAKLRIFLTPNGVSIHAPTRGATRRCHGIRYNRHRFQSTHPHGVRLFLFNDFLCFHISCFNPRTHTGCDAQQEEDIKDEYVSIHAPTRGATVCKVTYYKSIN